MMRSRTPCCPHPHRLRPATPRTPIDASTHRISIHRPAELHAEIQKESSKYVRHALRSAPNQPLSAKDAGIPTAVQASYDEIAVLAREKERLAERIVQLVARARTKLDRDLSRVLVLQGEPELATQPGYYYGSVARNPVAQLNETLRSAASLSELPATPVSASQGGPPQKRQSRIVYLRPYTLVLTATSLHFFILHLSPSAPHHTFLEMDALSLAERAW